MAIKKVDWKEVELDSYEQEIEDNIEKAKPVENEEYWKELIVQAAKSTIQEKERLVIEFQSKEAKEKAVQLLEKELGTEFHVINSG